MVYDVRFAFFLALGRGWGGQPEAAVGAPEGATFMLPFNELQLHLPAVGGCWLLVPMRIH